MNGFNLLLKFDDFIMPFEVLSRFLLDEKTIEYSRSQLYLMVTASKFLSSGISFVSTY